MVTVEFCFLYSLTHNLTNRFKDQIRLFFMNKSMQSAILYHFIYHPYHANHTILLEKHGYFTK